MVSTSVETMDPYGENRRLIWFVGHHGGMLQTRIVLFFGLVVSITLVWCLRINKWCPTSSSERNFISITKLINLKSISVMICSIGANFIRNVSFLQYLYMGAFSIQHSLYLPFPRSLVLFYRASFPSVVQLLSIQFVRFHLSSTYDAWNAMSHT